MVEAQVGTAICAHPSRARWAEELSQRLRAPVAMDTGALGSLANHDAAWRAAQALGCPWSMVLEDDVLLCDSFLTEVGAALGHLPHEGIVSLYTGTGRPHPQAVARSTRAAERRGASWLHSSRLFWGPAVLMPTERVDEMLHFVSSNGLPYDQRLSAWTRKTQTRVFYTVPSLVDHRDTPSTITNEAQPERRASLFIQDCKPTWNTRSVFLGR